MPRRFTLTTMVLFVAVFASTAFADVRGFDGAEQPTVEWGLTVGGTDPIPDQVDGIAIDSNGNVVISGVFFERVTIGETTFTSRGEGDIFLAAISPTGDVLWARQFGGPGDDNTFDLQSDDLGNVIASGWFSDTVDFGGTTLTSAGSVDMFVAKYRTGGTLAWARSFGGPAGDGGNEVAVLDNGEIAVSGISEGAFSAGGTTYPYGGGARDAYTLRIRANGELVWVRPFNSPGTERIRALTMNDRGDVFVGFQYSGQVTLGSRTVVSAGGWDGALAKLDPGGQGEWLLAAGGAGTDNVRGAAPGPDGSVYASGVFEGDAVVFGEALRDQGKSDDYLIRVSASGQPEWTVTVSGPGLGTGGEIRSEPGGVLMSSLIDGNLTIRNGSRTWPLQPPGPEPTSHLTALSAEGEPRYTFMPEPEGGSAAANAGALAVSRDGRSLASGLRFRGQMLVGDQLLTTTATGNSAIAYLKMPEPRRARVAFGKLRPRPLMVRAGKSSPLKVSVRSTGNLVANGVHVCLQVKGSKIRKQGLRVPGCRRLGRIPAGKTRKVSLPIRVRKDAAPGKVRLQVRLLSGNAGNSSRGLGLFVRR